MFHGCIRSFRGTEMGITISDFYIDRYAARYGLDYLELCDIALDIKAVYSEKEK